MINRENNTITISGDIQEHDKHYLLSQIFQAKEKYGYQDIIFDFSECKKIYPSIMVNICAYACEYKKDGVDFLLLLPKDEKLSRLFINTNWANIIDSRNRQTTYNGYLQLPATNYIDSKGQNDIVNMIMEKLLSFFDNLTRSDLSAIEWTVNEITDNVLVHSQSKSGGIVQLTNYSGISKRIELIVSDCGIGIPQSLRTIGIRDYDHNYLVDAIKEGVTNGKGQGNGLFGSHEITKLSGGYLVIESGHGYLMTEGNELTARNINIPILGTTIRAVISNRNKVELSTALKFKGKLYERIDYIETHYEMSAIEDSKKILVKDEVRSAGNRIEGAGLRTRIINILKIAELRKVFLDFSGLAIVSSSFADELVGKLYIEYDDKLFNEKIQLINYNKEISDLINHAINQRINSK